jgi:hypothetical protein
LMGDGMNPRFRHPYTFLQTTYMRAEKELEDILCQIGRLLDEERAELAKSIPLTIEPQPV